MIIMNICDFLINYTAENDVGNKHYLNAVVNYIATRLEHCFCIPVETTKTAPEIFTHMAGLSLDKQALDYQLQYIANILIQQLNWGYTLYVTSNDSSVIIFWRK